MGANPFDIGGSSSSNVTRSIVAANAVEFFSLMLALGLVDRLVSFGLFVVRLMRQ